MARARLVIIEDSAVLRSMLSAFAQTLGYEVTASTGTAEEALELITSDPDAVSAVVCDTRLPGMAGDELEQMLAQWLPDLPVLLLSADPVSIHQHCAEWATSGQPNRAGLAKPVTLDAFGDALAQLLHAPAASG
jgi:CheY-like chemotaxis protein